MPRHTLPTATERHELVVVGGGLAGVCAAIAAARHGMRVALVHDRGVLGGNSSSEVRVNPRGAAMMNAWARETGLVEELVLADRARNPERLGIGTISTLWDLTLYEAVVAESRLTLHLETLVDTVERAGRRVRAVSGPQHGSGRRLRLVAPYFVDATGDAVVGALAGAPFRQGREARADVGDSLLPPRADRGTQGSTILFRARDAGRPVPFAAPPWAHRYRTLPAPITARLPHFFTRGFGGFLAVEIGVPFDTIGDNPAIRHELLRHVLGLWDHLKRHDARAANLVLDWLGPTVGKRESRRLLGDHVLTQREVWGNTPFPDRVATGGWWLDVHTMGGIRARGPLQRRRCGEHEEVTVRPFSLPLRSLYSRGLDNLFMAGRDVSVTHAALGAVRVMLTCGMMGQAVGTAAAVARRHRTTPRAVAARYVAEVQHALVRDDAWLLDVPNADPRDLARRAGVTATSEAPLALPPAGRDVALGIVHAMILPLCPPRLDALALRLANTRAEAMDFSLALAPARDLWDFRPPDDTAVHAAVSLAPGPTRWVRFDFDLPVPAPGLWQLTLPPLAGITVAAATPVPGVSAAWKYLEWRERFQGNKDIAFALRLTPGQRPFGAASVTNGTARPERWPNLWISDPAAPLPQALTLTWPRAVTFDTVCLTFDTWLNEDAPELPPLWRAPTCVRDYVLSARVAGRWRRLLAVAGNYQRRRVHRFAPVAADALRLTVTATNGDPSARVYEVRVYRKG